MTAARPLAGATTASSTVLPGTETSGRVTRSRTLAGNAALASSGRAPLTGTSGSPAQKRTRRKRNVSNHGRAKSNHVAGEDKTGSADEENGGQDEESGTNDIDDNNETDEDEELSTDSEDGEAGGASAEDGSRRAAADSSDTEAELVDDPKAGPGQGTEAGGDKESELVGNPEDGEDESNMASHGNPAERDSALEDGRHGTEAVSNDEHGDLIRDPDDNRGRANEAGENNATNETSSSDANENAGSTLPEATPQMTLRASDTALGHSAVANPNDTGNSMTLAQPSLDDDDLEVSEEKSEICVYFSVSGLLHPLTCYCPVSCLADILHTFCGGRADGPLRPERQDAAEKPRHISGHFSAHQQAAERDAPPDCGGQVGAACRRLLLQGCRRPHPPCRHDLTGGHNRQAPVAHASRSNDGAEYY